MTSYPTRIRCAVTAVAVSLVAAAPASAWNAVGHMIVAKLAYDRLPADDRTRLDAALAEHPHYAEYLAADRPAATDAGAWAVMRAGVWPDWIRPPRRFDGDVTTHPVHRYHRGTWHYVNFPYVAGQASRILPDRPLPAETDILRQLAECRAFDRIAAGIDPDAEPDTTAEQNRAVRIAWLVHLVGDLHQPLHTASLVDERLLPGPDHHDQGGNLSAVRVEIGALPTRLHGFWDQLPGTDNHPASVLRIVEALQADPNLQADQLPELNAGDDVRAWAAESYELAVEQAYLDGKLPTAVWDESRPPLPAADDVPILPVGYERTARETARRRLVVAGHRLALLLAEAVR